MKHKYAAGDLITPLADTSNRNVRAGVYKIVNLLPVAGNGCQYRVKNALDDHERVFDEAQVRRAKV